MTDSEGIPPPVRGLAYSRLGSGGYAPVGISRWLGIPHHPLGPGAMHYLKDGVLLAALPMPQMPYSAHCLIADRHPNTDLSGWTPLQDEIVQKDLEVMIRECHALVASERGQLG